MHISFPISACPPSAADFAPGSAHLAGSLGPSRIVDADLGSCPLWAYPSPACRHSRIYQSTLLAGPILYKASISGGSRSSWFDLLQRQTQLQPLMVTKMFGRHHCLRCGSIEKSGGGHERELYENEDADYNY
ncbi:uncharacterized protein LOC104585321 [Brachypodium distachyon]|uniref:uncharacterized protein LOC104585321 n=1 Tax=Brachypodium distachyon TaxID=15368 RepID=UPI000D0D460D|nr:uncharacterized protein LOC104585321 [Brachypodium distachyon]|eukprot:XP_024311198.1 uncharacterized protein LOC104585321 [Brachypodium distachyon]